MEASEVTPTKAAVERKNVWGPRKDESRTSNGQAMAPSPHAMFRAATRRALADGTTVPAITLPAVRPAPRPRPTAKSAKCARPKPAQAIATHPTADVTEP